MATTLTSFIPSALRSNFEHSNFSYSYSDLPVFQSELDKEAKPKNVFTSPAKRIVRSLNSNKSKRLPLNLEKSKAEIPEKVKLENADFANNNAPLRPSKSFSRVEGLKKKFEFQSRLAADGKLSNSTNSKYYEVKEDIKKNRIGKSYSADDERANDPEGRKLPPKSNSKSLEDEKKLRAKNALNRRDSPDKESDKSTSLASSVLRLRNSIFSSLKLPRKVSAKMNSQMSGHDTLPGRSYGMTSSAISTSTLNKRKSAVELLAESKAFYVKSETVLDRKQELPLRVNSTLSTLSNSGTHFATLSGRHRRNINGEPLQNQLRRLLESTNCPSPVNITHSQTLRYPDKVSKNSYNWDTPPITARSHYNSGTFSGNSSSGTSGSKGHVKSDPEYSRMSGCYSSKSLNRPSSSGDNRIFFPDSFVVPKPSKSDPANVFSNSFSIESPFSSPEKIDARQILSVVDAYESSKYAQFDSKSDYYDDRDLIENYSTISPPAEYALTERSNYRYVRSNSHSHTIKTNQENPYVINFNSHKSLPDLHRQGENYGNSERRMSNMGGSGHYLSSHEAMQRSRGTPIPGPGVHSAEALSSYSKATSGRSYRSSALSSKCSDYSRRSTSVHNSENSVHTGKGSSDEVYYYNRSGSSYARDSGGSSGHCSGPLGPPSLRGLPPMSTGSLQQRRDSGSSTQHSSTRSNRYSSYFVDKYREVEDPSHLEYHVSAPIQFQDGVPYNHGPSMAVNATVSISTNYDTFRSVQSTERPSVVGIHFQASIPPVQFQDTQPAAYGYNGSYPNDGFIGRRESGTRESRHLIARRPASSGCNQTNACYEGETEGARSLPQEIENSPPSVGLGNFKRQRCLRYKHRNTPRRPILRSKSDISDRYWRGEGKPSLPVIERTCDNSPPSSENCSPGHVDHVDRAKLNKFFDQLGMDDDTYKEVILKDLKKRRRKKNRKKNKTSPLHGDLKPADSDSKCTDDEANDELSSSFASSELSFPDSNLIPNNADFTVQGSSPNNQRPYRTYEPLSIVERNARIIKWLCNCRKMQAV